MSDRPARDSSVERLKQIERVRGMADVDAASFQRQVLVRRSLLETIARHGYVQVDTPIVEPTELFLRKSGGERVAQLYAFRYRDRDIALRPEHTASILRMYVDSMQSAPLPVRLCYAGPIFRYEKPQAGRNRQFTEVGCELLGAEGPVADAEVIHLALEGLASLGIRTHLVLGHVGLVLEYLDRLPVRQRARDWLVWSMERVRKGRAVDLETDIAGLVSGDRLSDLFDQMSDTFAEVPPEQLESWVLGVLQEVGIQTQGGTRTPEEIVAGVIAKLNRHSDESDVRRSFEFIQQIARLRGRPEQVIPELQALIRGHNLHQEPIERIQRVLALLESYGHDTSDIELSPGLGRGLHYYTGMLFEIYADGRGEQQLCGGGRYDDLAQSLGARQPLPASGFTYGLERIVAIASIDSPAQRGNTLVVPSCEQATENAIRFAETLRASGEIVEIDVRGRSVGANRRYAVHSGKTRLVVVDESGRVETEEFGGTLNTRVTTKPATDD